MDFKSWFYFTPKPADPETIRVLKELLQVERDRVVELQQQLAELRFKRTDTNKELPEPIAGVKRWSEIAKNVGKKTRKP